MKAFYFSTTERKLRYDDNREISVGITHEVDEDKLEPCEFGLHASKRIIDALRYAPGPILWIVELDGKIIEGDDKCCASKRTYISEFDATDILRAFARRQALINIEKIKPYCTDDEYSLVVKYLETGDENIRGVAQSAARSAAYSAARSAARSAAYSAAWSAESAAWSAHSAARSAAYSATQSAARSAQSVARSARLVARSVARSAQSVAQSVANEMLTDMIREATGWDINTEK